jgi:hypothetical protein
MDLSDLDGALISPASVRGQGADFFVEDSGFCALRSDRRSKLGPNDLGVRNRSAQVHTSMAGRRGRSPTISGASSVKRGDPLCRKPALVATAHYLVRAMWAVLKNEAVWEEKLALGEKANGERRTANITGDWLDAMGDSLSQLTAFLAACRVLLGPCRSPRSTRESEPVSTTASQAAVEVRPWRDIRSSEAQFLLSRYSPPGLV